ncbi:MAG TPA: O-antigen ligase family protein [Candidatus Saccharimonadia bacterium]|jgi:hypothetical protein|nr:O-antigen ligase family protein [Candidatus Saccharimonadia bacterium]
MNQRKLTTAVQWGLLLLVALMPFHAFLSVWLGSLTHHQAIIQSWKEVLIALLVPPAAWLAWRDPAYRERLRQPWVWAAAAFALIAIIVTAAARPGLTQAAFGLKTDLEFLLAGTIALIAATPGFARRLVVTVVAGAAAVSAFAVCEVWLLPADFLTHFGYGAATILPYQHIAAGISTLRFPSTLGGPNQLGTYLILPLCLTLTLVKRRPWLWAVFGAAVVALITSYSRGAWLGAVAAVICVGWLRLPAALRRRFVVVLGLATIGIALTVPLTLRQNGPWQYLILHSSVANHDDTKLSDSQHALSLKDGVRQTLATPLGHGLGSAGPATFHAGTVHIIEDNYLQLGYETGLLGLIAFVVCLVLLLKRLAPMAKAHPLASASFGAVVGVSVVAVVLPAWTDSTTALITWICAGTAAAGIGKAAHV